MRSQKVIGFLSFVFTSAIATLVFAEGEAAAGSSDKVKMALAISAGFGMAIAAFGGAISQSKALSTAVDGIARNPGAAQKIFAPTLMLGLVFIESLVLFSFLIMFLLLGKI